MSVLLPEVQKIVDREAQPFVGIADLETFKELALSIQTAVLKKAVEVAEREAKLYKENGEDCQRGGNLRGAMNDAQGKMACELVARELRKLIEE